MEEKNKEERKKEKRKKKTQRKKQARAREFDSIVLEKKSGLCTYKGHQGLSYSLFVVF
jgi:hypothetical protein